MTINQKNKTDMVNHPNHYMSKTGLETIDVIEAFTDDLNGIEAVDTGNILKYICRWKKKNEKKVLVFMSQSTYLCVL